MVTCMGLQIMLQPSHIFPFVKIFYRYLVWLLGQASLWQGLYICRMPQIRIKRKCKSMLRVRFEALIPVVKPLAALPF